MSKLYEKYLSCKSENPNTIFLFKSGIFYLALDEDATKISKLFNFKLTNLNDKVLKCGFPEKRLDFYSNLLNSQNISFQIIDSNYSIIDNYSDYLNNLGIKNIIRSILDIDFNNITYKDCFELLSSIQDSLKKIYK